MNVIIYDESSMVKFVKSIEQFPVLYDTKYPEHHSREKQNECWMQVATEMGDDITLCRDKWKNVKASYTRYLRRIHQGTNSSRPYYLAPYLDYLTPFIKFGRSNKNTSSKHESPEMKGPSLLGIDLDYHSDEYVKARVMPKQGSSTSNEIVLNVGKSKKKKKKDNQCNSVNKLKAKRAQDIEDEVQINFFRSLLPEVDRMTKKQKLHFKQTVLKTIDDILYSSSEQTL